MSDSDLRSTPLHDLHHELGGRMVDFAGWSLPIQFEGVVAEHRWCRESAALFDVSHMGVVELRGDDPAASLEQLTPAGVATLKPGRMRYGLLTNDDGGVIDDFMVSNAGDHLVMVINAARRSIDIPHLQAGLTDVGLVERDDVALLALQGPAAVDVLASLAPAVADLSFLELTSTEIDGASVVASRSGYTGEDGYELIVPADAADGLARRLLADERVHPAGLGARDTLRLEAGLCLYGNDLDETTSPVEADLVWTMPTRRREAGDFPGAERIQAELADGPSRIRAGIAASGRPVRDGAEIQTREGDPIGAVTSGGFGPSVDHPVAMGYVRPDLAAPGTELRADVRGRLVDVAVAELPFSPHRYHRIGG